MRKVEMNQFGLQNIYTWKCHKETPCSYLNKNVIFFFENGEQEGKIGPVCGVGTSGRGDIRKRSRRMNVVKCYPLVYENGKMRPVETIPGMRRGGIKENDGGGIQL
jgi:hypothetical protein